MSITGGLTALTARHWYSKESFAATYWTLIGPGFSFHLSGKCVIRLVPPMLYFISQTAFLDDFRVADDTTGMRGASGTSTYSLQYHQ